nr:Arm DNA-binding domain-containing protein [Agarivorans litoreus]
MPRKVVPLSATQVAQAKAKHKENNLSDGGGLFLRVWPNGAKAWCLNYVHPIKKHGQKYHLVSIQL